MLSNIARVRQLQKKTLENSQPFAGGRLFHVDEFAGFNFDFKNRPVDFGHRNFDIWKHQKWNLEERTANIRQMRCEIWKSKLNCKGKSQQ